MPLHASSYIKTTTAIVQRVRDQLSFTYTAKPQAMTAYVQFVELGSILETATDRYILHIGDATTFFQIRNFAGIYTVTYANGITSSVSVNVGSAPTIGQLVELRATLTSAGVVQIYESIAGATETTAGASSARVLPVAWGAQTLWVNSRSTSNVGWIALQKLAIVRGVVDLATARLAVGT